MFPIEGSAPQLPEFRSLALGTEIAARPETFPDGRGVVVSGESDLKAQSLAASADAVSDFRNSGSLLGCAQIIRQFTPDFNTQELWDYVKLLEPSPTGEDFAPLGMAAPEALAQTLADFDVPAHVEKAQSSEDLAHYLESGSGVLVAVNLGELCNSPADFGNGDANAVAVALAVAREANTGDIVGWYLNDVVARQARTLIDAPRMQRAWLDAGGWLIVTEIVRRRPE
jgi:hypothetical protein